MAILFYDCFFLVLVVLIHTIYASSFYDNPEQDPIPPQDSADDLHHKWDFEVFI